VAGVAGRGVVGAAPPDAAVLRLRPDAGVLGDFVLSEAVLALDWPLIGSVIRQVRVAAIQVNPHDWPFLQFFFLRLRPLPLPLPRPRASKRRSPSNSSRFISSPSVSSVGCSTKRSAPASTIAETSANTLFLASAVSTRSSPIGWPVRYSGKAQIQFCGDRLPAEYW